MICFAEEGLVSITADVVVQLDDHTLHLLKSSLHALEDVSGAEDVADGGEAIIDGFLLAFQ